MTSYTITVNGKSYDVTVQKKREISAASVSLPAGFAATTIPVAAVPAAVVPTTKYYSTEGGKGEKVAAPIPGKIIEIKVRVGESVKKGQELLIMEAMKMNNPILAANDGVISELFVKINDLVQSGQTLLSIR